MVAGTDAGRKALSGRWATPPWNEESPEWIALDQRLSNDHLARWIDALVGELDLEAFVQGYAKVGVRAYRPDLLLKGVLYEMFQGRLSPAQWTRDFREVEPIRWLLFGLEPSRSCLYNFRDRVGSALEQWQQQILAKAQAEGHTQAERGAIDGTFTAAYGSRHRLINAKTLEKRWQELETAVAADQADASRAGSSYLEQVLALVPQTEAALSASVPPQEPRPEATLGIVEQTLPTPAAAIPSVQAGSSSRPGWMATTPAGRQEQRKKYQRARQRMQELQTRHHQSHNKRSKRQRRPVERLVVSATEPDAALGLDKLKTFRPLYNVQLLCDLDAPFVLGYQVFAAVTDHDLLIPVVEKTQQFTGRWPRTLLGDGIYASVLDLFWCEQHGITIYAPVDSDDAARAKPGRISKRAFTWLPDQQTYRCPEGHLLEFTRAVKERRGQLRELTVLRYGCALEHCQACPRQKACTKSSQQGRTIKRSEHEELVDILRLRMSETGQQLYKLRKQTVELGFADLKQHRGLQRFRSYGLSRARIQVGLLVLVHNGLALLQARQELAASAVTPYKETG
jgi:transposase